VKVKTYPVKVSGVEIVPDPVARGQPATFKVKASTGRRQRFNLLLFFFLPVLMRYASCFL
jgi:hypothetical protein